ncbi:MAG: hypothetical protein CMJ46_01760 [Planctomyces sp.]|nr:hypothetical protein [Planctomyces sp.]
MSLSDNNQERLPGYPAAMVADALKMLFVGLVFVLFAGAILWVNEWNNMVRLKQQAEEDATVIEIDDDMPVDGDNEGRLVHLSGELKSTTPIKEDWLKLNVDGLRLFRRVQTFEENAKARDEPLAYLAGQWKDQPAVVLPAVNETIPAQTVRSHYWYAENVRLGAHPVSETLLDRLTRFRQLDLQNFFDVEQFPSTSSSTTDSSNEESTLPPARWQPLPQGLMWGTPGYPPAAGDVRVLYYVVPVEMTVSLVARQGAEGRLEPFITSEGEVIERIRPGVVSWQNLYPEGKQPVNWVLWMFRILGCGLMWAGCWFLILPGSRLIRQLDIRNFQLQFEPVRMSALAGVLLSVLVMSAAWIYYQPIWGTTMIVIILAMVGGGGYYFWRKLRLPKRISGKT